MLQLCPVCIKQGCETGSEMYTVNPSFCEHLYHAQLRTCWRIKRGINSGATFAASQLDLPAWLQLIQLNKALLP